MECPLPVSLRLKRNCFEQGGDTRVVSPKMVETKQLLRDEWPSKSI